jgi:hypothetical protein
MSHLEGNETVQRLPKRIACLGCLGPDVSAVGRHKLLLKALFPLGSGLKWNDSRAHRSCTRAEEEADERVIVPSGARRAQ